MTETTLVTITPATAKYVNPIAKRFFDSLETVASEIRSTGKLTYDSVASIVGPHPVIPDSPDMDARLEAYEETQAYTTLLLNVEEKLRAYAAK